MYLRRGFSLEASFEQARAAYPNGSPQPKVSAQPESDARTALDAEIRSCSAERGVSYLEALEVVARVSAPD
jgi:hypothetical protein